MKLVQRLREPYKKKLELANQSYPSIAGAIFTELTNANHPADIIK